MCGVTIQGALSSKPRSVVAVVANNSPCTTISQRLANQLGLTQFHEVYIKDMMGMAGPWIAKWKRSIYPVIMLVPELDNMSVYCYPVINCCEGDAFWEMIIGQDVWLKNMNIMKLYLSVRTKPTQGPGFRENVQYMGHNIGYASIPEILERNLSEYLEYQCLNSKSVSRLAINHKKKTIAVKYITSDDVYSYKKVPIDLIMKIVEGESKGKTLSNIKNACEFTKRNSFPDTSMVFSNT